MQVAGVSFGSCDSSVVAGQFSRMICRVRFRDNATVKETVHGTVQRLVLLVGFVCLLLLTVTLTLSKTSGDRHGFVPGCHSGSKAKGNLVFVDHQVFRTCRALGFYGEH